jgi:hypothetical protein
MNAGMTKVRELAGWGFDDYQYRPQSIEHEKYTMAKRLVAQRSSFEQSDALIAITEELRQLLAPHSQRTDLLAEMSGLSWSLGVVDLRSLIAFQRRLSFRPGVSTLDTPAAHEWLALIDFSFGTSKPIDCDLTHDHSMSTLTLRSTNPNLHIRAINDAASPISIQTGGPFFEVAHFRNRWFLRDGYHRAYALLRAGIFQVPAVIVHASTLDQLGAVQPWFFPETILFSKAPPLVTDFLNNDLVLEYERPALIKTLRITWHETLALDTSTGELL